jgi:hypothetical protein
VGVSAGAVTAGRDIRARVAADVAGFAEEHDASIVVKTIALTEEQVDDLGLVRAPMDRKKQDRYSWWPHAWTVELEAASPVDLGVLIAAAIEDFTDADTRRAVLEREAQQRDELMSQMEADS